MEAIDTATARKRLSELVSRVLYAKERITLTRYGKACAVLVPIDDVESEGQPRARASAATTAEPNGTNKRVRPGRKRKSSR
jgi:prevent-host-death family protein